VVTENQDNANFSKCHHTFSLTLK